LEELGQPPHGWGWPFDQERNIAQRLLEVLGAVLGRNPRSEIPANGAGTLIVTSERGWLLGRILLLPLVMTY